MVCDNLHQPLEKSRQMSLTNAEGFNYATQVMKEPPVESDDIIAYSLPARSNIGQTSDCPEITNPVD